jgi:hypothetical protein
MKRSLLLAVAGIGAVVALAPAASAQLYGGAGYTVVTADDGNGGDLNFGALLGRLGYKTNPFFGVEGEFSIGVQDESFDVLGTTVDVGLDNEFGVFAVGFLPLPMVGDLFGRVGYANVTVDASGAGTTLSEDGSGLAYGGGLQFNVAFLKLRAEYTRYEPEDGEFDSYGLSAILQF